MSGGILDAVVKIASEKPCEGDNTIRVCRVSVVVFIHIYFFTAVATCIYMNNFIVVVAVLAMAVMTTAGLVHLIKSTFRNPHG